MIMILNIYIIFFILSTKELNFYIKKCMDANNYDISANDTIKMPKTVFFHNCVKNYYYKKKYYILTISDNTFWKLTIICIDKNW